jgi:type II secretory pathway component GspD/PulD (secretin)
MKHPISQSLIASFVILILILPLTASAQQQAPAARVEQPSAAATTGVAGMRGRVIEIRHRESVELIPVLRPLLSGIAGAVIEASRELRTISIRDYPENIATIEEAIRRLDVPRASRPVDPDIELTMHIMIASNDQLPDDDFPTSLRPVVSQLKNTFNYRHYKLVTPILHRARLNQKNSTLYQSSGNSTYQMAGSAGATKVNYQYGYQEINLEAAGSGRPSVLIRNFRFELDGKGDESGAALGNALIASNLSIRDGESLVVGSASLRDRAVIIVLSLRVTN